MVDWEPVQVGLRPPPARAPRSEGSGACNRAAGILVPVVAAGGVPGVAALKFIPLILEVVHALVFFQPSFTSSVPAVTA